jgi:thymidylate synthase (FAD)
MLHVEIINKEQVSNLFKNWGVTSSTCYNTPEKYAEKVGQSCNESGHYSGSRTEYIKFKITGADRGSMEQLFRHELGTRTDEFESAISIDSTMIVKNMKSFRYVDMSKQFDYTVPVIISKSKRATEVFNKAMENIRLDMVELQQILDEEFPNANDKMKLEASQFLLPRATNTSAVVGLTLEALTHYFHKRLCERTQPEHRELAKLMREKVLEILPQFESKFVAHCEHLLWCPEGEKCCGKRPTRDMLIEKLNK